MRPYHDSDASAGDPLRARFVPPSAKPKQIKQVTFGTFGAHDIRRLSHVEVIRSEPDDADPLPHGTCGLAVQDCQGHFGHIDLSLPVFHNGFFKHTVAVLRCICKGCSRVLVPKDQCAKVVKCMHCGFVNGKVKREAGWQCPRIVHERYGDARNTQRDKAEERARLANDLDAAMEANDEALRPLLSEPKKVVDDLNPIQSPANLLCSTLLVPPVVLRPSDDDLTRMLRTIVAQSQEVQRHMDAGEQPAKVWQAWEVLQQLYASYGPARHAT
eukprot:gene30911-26786_t